MSVLSDLKSRAAGLARAEKRRYAGDHDRPLGGYLTTMTTYAAVVGALAGTALVRKREIPERLAVSDIALSALATHKLSRLVTKDPVTSPLRAPFTMYRGQAGPAELAEQVRGGGAQKTVGELVTCPFCVDLWVATGLAAGYVFAPRATRLAVGMLAIVAGADALQFGYSWLQERE